MSQHRRGFLEGGPFASPTAQLALLVLIAALVACAGVNALPPLDRDEARFAQASAQMLESGDFVTIRFQENERNKKPVGIHWLQAASVAAFSSVEAREIWAYRLPSIVGAVLAVIFTFVAGRALFSLQVAFLGALIMACAPGLAGEATIAKTDAVLLAAITAAQACLALLYGAIRKMGPIKSFWAYGFWIAFGLGVLIKGPIAPLVCGLTIVFLCIRDRSAALIFALRPIRGLAIVTVIVAPWAVMIGVATEGRFFIEAVGGDMAGKIGDAQERHGGPPGYHLALVWLLLWPAAALLGPGLVKAFRGLNDWRLFFLIAWAAPSWLVFELTATKLPHYTLPLFPALALLSAHAAIETADWRSLFHRAGITIYAGIGVAAAIAVVAAAAVYGDRTLAFWSASTALILTAMTTIAAVLFWRGESIAGALAACAASAFLAFTLLEGVLPNLDRLALSPRLAAAIENETRKTQSQFQTASDIALAGYYEPSAIFLLGGDVMTTDGAGAARHLFDNENAISVVEARLGQDFLKATRDMDGALIAVATIDGVNYSNGRQTTLTVYRNASSKRDHQ